jgi:hypothetical protein
MDFYENEGARMTITQISEIIQKWTGWCPNAQTIRTSSTILSTPPFTLHPAQPDGGAGGSGRIARGAGLVAGSIKTLIRDKQLLWFSLLTGLVMLFMFTAAYTLHVLGTYPCPMLGYPVWLTLAFAIELITVFCINFLLAGLILSVSQKKSGRISTFREGLVQAKSHWQSIAGWSLGMAVAGTALVVMEFQYFGDYNFTIFQVMNQFPFNFILLPEHYHIGPIGGPYHIFSAVTFTIYAMIINLILFVLTLFVVPAIVLENKRIPAAIAESISLFKKTWGEIIICLLLFGLILLGISLTSLMFRLVYGIVSPEMLLFWYPGDGWITGAALYMLAWCILAFIGSTAIGIATRNLYSFGKTGRMPDKFPES